MDGRVRRRPLTTTSLLEVTRFDALDAYWVPTWYSVAGPRPAPMETASRIDTPRPFARLAAGPVAVAGGA